MCESLIIRGEKLEEDSNGGCRRLELLCMLCEMNPKAALILRSYCVSVENIDQGRLHSHITSLYYNTCSNRCPMDVIIFFDVQTSHNTSIRSTHHFSSWPLIHHNTS